MSVHPTLHPLPADDMPLSKSRESTFDSLRNFYFEPTPLNGTQLRLLARKQFATLTRRTVFWFALLLAGAAIVWGKGETPPAREVPVLFGHVEWTTRLWFALLFTSMIPYGFLLPKIMKPQPVDDERHVDLKHAAWVFWLTVVAFIFISGNWALAWQPRNSQNEFHLAQQTFVYLTIVGQVFTVLFLSSSRKAIFSVVGIGILLPFYYKIVPELRMNPVGLPPPWASIHIFFGGQLAIYLISGWFLPLGQRREILLEEEHRRAEAERARANHFIVTVGHDLKQPLTAINLRLATLAKRTAQDPGISALAREIQQQTGALGEMIQASFDLSRLHSGTWEVSPREVALPNLVERVTAEFHSIAGEKGVVLQVEHVPEYVVWTDPDALGRILRNLLANAIKYTPAQGIAGPGRVAVEFEVKAELMHISISDNGIGIPASRTDDIFKEYVQLDNPERDRNKGFGLGLSIVRGLANLLNHDLTFASTEGSGSRFSIAVQIKSRIPLELLSSQMEALSAPRFADMVVFLVDDDESPRNALVEHLLDWGCYVVDADSAAELIEKLRTEDIPLHKSEFILSDYRLKDGKTGVEAISAIRMQRGSQAIMAAIWTGESGPEVLREVAHAEIQLLTKPINLQELASALKKADVTDEMDVGRTFVPAK